MKHGVLMLVLICLLTGLFAATERMVVRITDPSPADLQRFLNEEADIASYHPGIYLDLVVDQDQYLMLSQDYPTLSITQTEAQLKVNLRAERDIPGYRNYAQMVTELLQLQAQYPYLMQLTTIGGSWGAEYAAQNIPYYLDFDHTLWAVKVSANVQVDEDEPAFYFVGEHHAREPISTEVCMGILIHLLEGYDTDLSIQNLLDSSEIWIIPLLNPDGHKIVIDQTDIWWRKNIRDNNNNQSFDHLTYGSGYDGVDLNRNYSLHWGYTSATDNFLSATYHGPYAFSEPETQALRDLLSSKRFLAGISYHTYGEYVLYPYGYVSNIVAPDGPEMQALAIQMASLLPKVSGGYYSPMPSWQLYPVSGSSEDWIYGETGAFAYTIEMADVFIPPAAQVPAIVQNNVVGAMELLNRKNYKILQGHVTDALSGEPLEAIIYVQGIDDNPIYRTPIRSDAQFGSYYRLLPTGAFTVRYLREGYLSEERVVTITSNDRSIEDVQLMPATPYLLTITIKGDFFQPLGNATLVFDHGDGTSYESDEYGVIEIEDFHPGQYLITISKPGFETLSILREISTPNIGFRLTSFAVLNEDFEQNLNNWQTTGTWNRSTVYAHSGNYSLADTPTSNYQNNQNTFCKLIEPLHLQSVQNANLQFWTKCLFALDADNVSLEISLNNQTWTVLDYFTGVSDWTLRSYNLNSFLGNDLYIRFRLFTDSSGTANGIFIDDLKLYTNADVTASPEEQVSPAVFTLSAYPNPFRQASTLQVKADANTLESMDLKIFNLKGQLVKTLASQPLPKGSYRFEWDGSDNHGIPTASGIYFIRLSSASGKTLAGTKILRLK